MADAAAAENAGNQGGAKGKGSMKTIIIISVAAVVLVAGGGGGAYFFLQKSQAAAKTTAEKGKKGAANSEDEEAASDEPAAKKAKADSLELPDDSLVKHVIELQPYIVNLADQGEARYLRLTVSLGVGGEDGAEEAKKPNPLFTTRVRNAMLAVLTTKSSAEVLTAEGKAKLRKDLLRAARAASEEPHVEAIYITEFIVQL